MKKIDELLDIETKDRNDDVTIERLLEDKSIERFVLKHDLKHDTIIRGMNPLLTYKEEKAICEQCDGLYECQLSSTGMTPRIRYYNGEILLGYRPCRYNKDDSSFKNINRMHMPKKVFEADIHDIDLIGSERKEIHQHLMRFLKKRKTDDQVKGMYLSGVYGSGKTYILAALANELAKQGEKIIFAYYPDLVREIKSSIGTGELEANVEKLKTTDILMLDDIGGESVSGFIRDEVLGPVLQHRLLDKKPTFFSSNLKMKSLPDAMRLNQSKIEQTKAYRIFERIRSLADEFTLSEKPQSRT